ncbi:diguanylate cyclase [Halobacillus litoralis]|uniref:diguanylate cyclase domain-containing protein n=1 Tax=Halobacillus litoralis TaxID=45668 RepID=UPI001CD2FC62|nr:diguanylate cyclase [Halobacillus litoralis]MCA0970249.1 diguanylate cyclase [Halobacillus litoralis]
MKMNYLHIVLAVYIGLGVLIGVFFSLTLPVWMPLPDDMRPLFTIVCVITGVVLGLGHYLIFSIFIKKFIQHFQNVLKAVRRGDLSARSDMKSTGLLGDLRNNVNGTIEALQKTQRSMQRDDLTRLPNRLALQQFFHHTESKIGRSYALYFLDLNRFKKVNDTYGHLMGDLVLKFMARTISKEAGKGTRLYRLAGDEFILVHPVIDPENEVPFKCRQIRKPFEDFITIEGISLKVDLSIGVYVFQFGHEELDSILDKADQAMYDAKSSKDKVYVSYENKPNNIPS